MWFISIAGNVRFHPCNCIRISTSMRQSNARYKNISIRMTGIAEMVYKLKSPFLWSTPRGLAKVRVQGGRPTPESNGLVPLQQ